MRARVATEAGGNIVTFECCHMETERIVRISKKETKSETTFRKYKELMKLETLPVSLGVSLYITRGLTPPPCGQMRA